MNIQEPREHIDKLHLIVKKATDLWAIEHVSGAFAYVTGLGASGFASQGSIGTWDIAPSVFKTRVSMFFDRYAPLPQSSEIVQAYHISEAWVALVVDRKDIKMLPWQLPSIALAAGRTAPEAMRYGFASIQRRCMDKAIKDLASDRWRSRADGTPLDWIASDLMESTYVIPELCIDGCPRCGSDGGQSGLMLHKARIYRDAMELHDLFHLETKTNNYARVTLKTLSRSKEVYLRCPACGATDIHIDEIRVHGDEGYPLRWCGL